MGEVKPAQAGEQKLATDRWHGVVPVHLHTCRAQHLGGHPAIWRDCQHQPALPSLGAGECSSGPTCAAIANAIHDALGVRVRAMPFTPEQVLHAASQAQAFSSNP
mgnify:CR=1 FL=1